MTVSSLRELLDKATREQLEAIAEAAEAFERADEDAGNLSAVGAYGQEDEQVWLKARNDLRAALAGLTRNKEAGQ